MKAVKVQPKRAMMSQKACGNFAKGILTFIEKRFTTKIKTILVEMTEHELEDQDRGIASTDGRDYHIGVVDRRE
jgi:hypothetical protein